MQQNQLFAGHTNKTLCFEVKTLNTGVKIGEFPERVQFFIWNR